MPHSSYSEGLMNRLLNLDLRIKVCFSVCIFGSVGEVT